MKKLDFSNEVNMNVYKTFAEEYELIPDRYMEKSVIGDNNISYNTKKCLVFNDITTVGKLLSKRPVDLVKINGFDQQILAEVKNLCESMSYKQSKDCVEESFENTSAETLQKEKDITLEEKTKKTQTLEKIFESGSFADIYKPDASLCLTENIKESKVFSSYTVRCLNALGIVQQRYTIIWLIVLNSLKKKVSCFPSR